MGAVSFTSFQNLTGGTGNDIFKLTTASAGLSGVLNGGGGTDTLVGFNVNNTWSLTGTQSGASTA